MIVDGLQRNYCVTYKKLLMGKLFHILTRGPLYEICGGISSERSCAQMIVNIYVTDWVAHYGCQRVLQTPSLVRPVPHCYGVIEC